VATVLLPFAPMCTSGCVCQDAMQLLLASRLALVPKCDASAPPPQPGQPAPVQDYRPLGVEDTLVRLISTSLMTQEGKAVGKKLAPQQLAVSVSDGCAIITSALQCVYDHGHAGREGCDFLLMDMKNAYGQVLREAILRGLYEYAPHLRIITYGSDTRLFHSLHGFVGWVKTGVKQGDPLSTLFFAVALQAALIEIDRDIATNHPGSRPWRLRTTALVSAMVPRFSPTCPAMSAGSSS
jgi:hypothetical protein